MVDLLVTTAEQQALRALIAAEPAPGLLPSRRILQHVAVLIPCDSVAVEVLDPSGHRVDSICLPRCFDAGDPRLLDGSLVVGIVHKALDPRHRMVLAARGLVDELVVGRRGPGHIVQLSLDRVDRRFSARDAAVLRMIAPALERLLQSASSAVLPATLTPQERRVLQLVATGLSNTEIADRLYVAPCTVRKHLEHTFRKLGVSTRLAAATVYQQYERSDARVGGAAGTYA